jgi:hypothetical protein
MKEVRKVMTSAKQMLEQAKAALEKESNEDRRKEYQDLIRHSEEEIAKAEKMAQIGSQDGMSFLTRLSEGTMPAGEMMGAVLGGTPLPTVSMPAMVSLTA